MKVKVYLNEGPGLFFGYEPTDTLRLAAEFEMEDRLAYAPPGEHPVAAHIIWGQLNTDNPMHDWSIAYRANGNRSLSVGDVIVLGEVAFAVESFSFKVVTLSGGMP